MRHAPRTAVLVLASALATSCAPTARDTVASAPTAGAPVARAPQATTPVVDTGVLEQAPYRVDIPPGWNGELVMLLHGYEPQGMPRETPWPANEATPVFLAQGYAVAQSAYSSQGWAVPEALLDNERLRARFTRAHGVPQATWLVGFSLGGHIALASLEQHAEAYDGALSLCGVNLPASTVFNDAILTALVAFDHLFPGEMGLAEGGLADPDSPPMVDPQALEAALQGNESAAALLAQRLDTPRQGLAGALMLNYMVLREMQARAGGFPADNRDTVYAGFGDDAAFNAGVRRYAGDPDAMRYVAANAALGGALRKPVVIQTNSDDPTVPDRFDRVYPELVEAAGDSSLLTVLPDVGTGHCDFSPEQVQAAFAVLTGQAQAGDRHAPSPPVPPAGSAGRP